MTYSYVMPQCAYGCDREAIKFFSSTKRWCCSNSVNQCPAKRERDASQKRGKAPKWTNDVHPRGMFGKKPWNAGKFLSSEHREKIRTALTGNPNCRGVASTPEKETLRRQRIHETAQRNGKTGGYRQGSGVGKKCWYDSPIAGRVHLQSTYELRLAQLFDAVRIVWQRSYERFPYTWEGKNTYYIPDFVVFTINGRCYIETKGFQTKKDKAKWNAFPHPLLVFGQTELELLERYGSVAEGLKASVSNTDWR